MKTVYKKQFVIYISAVEIYVVSIKYLKKAIQNRFYVSNRYYKSQ